MLSAILALAALTAPATAQNWPERTITMIVPFAPGGATDGIARIVAEGMSRRLGQTVVVENVGGAGGTLGIAKAKNAAADGYTIALGHFGTHAAAVALYRKLPYDPVADFVPIAWVASASIVLSARKDIPAANLKEFIAYARQQGDKITNGHSGVGSTAHVSCAYFASLAGFKPTEVPYKGNGPMVQDLLAGRLDYSCDQLASAAGRIKGGQVKALALAAPRRSPAAPDVPTSIEAGLPGWQANAWSALYAPKNVPAPVVAKLREAAFAAIDDAQVRQRLEAVGAEVPTPEERAPDRFAAFMREEIERWGKVIRDAQIPPSD